MYPSGLGLQSRERESTWQGQSGGPWKGTDDVEYATLERLDWFNHCRLLEPDRRHPAGRARAAYRAAQACEDNDRVKQPSLRQSWGGPSNMGQGLGVQRRHASMLQSGRTVPCARLGNPARRGREGATWVPATHMPSIGQRTPSLRSGLAGLLYLSRLSPRLGRPRPACRRVLMRSPEPSSNEQLPLVSIITAVRNGSRYLSAVIESVLAQDYPRIEHIVIDDGSDDDDATIRILEQYPHLRWWTRENQGQYATQNEGLAAATGSIVSVICADDCYAAPSAVSIAVDYLLEHREYGCAFGRTLNIGEDGDLLEAQTRIQGRLALQLLKYYCTVPHCALFVRRMPSWKPARCSIHGTACAATGSGCCA